VEGEVVAEEQDGGPGGEDEGGVDLGRVVSVGLVLLWWEIQGTYGSQTPVEDGDQALDWG
jgi:hypothetical protein